MQIARDLAGFSMAQADILRKAMGKKIADLLAEQKEKFIDGCVKNGIYKDLAEKIFSFIEPFADYGFNRSHAACYALIGYQTAYLKARWPVEFMAALLTADQQDSDRVAIEIEECRKMGFKILAPDINESFDTFTVITDKTKENKAVGENVKLDTIRFGLNAIKNVGQHIVEVIIDERKASGPYKDIFDFLTRVTDRDLNKKSLESLIKCGAFDNFGDRGFFLSNLEKLLDFNKEVSKNLNSKQESLFASKADLSSFSRPQLNKGEKIKDLVKINWEKELLGLFISNHPILMFKEKLEPFVSSIKSLSINQNKDLIIISGVITNIKKIITRSGESMIFAKIEDPSASLEILVFPKLFKENLDIWQEGSIILVAGSLSEKDSDLKLLTNFVEIINPDLANDSIENFKKKLFNFKKDNPRGFLKNNNKNKVKKPEKKEKKVIVEKTNKKISPLKIIIKNDLGLNDLSNLKNTLDAYPGDDPVYFKVTIKGKAKILKSELKTKNSKEIKKIIQENFSQFLNVLSSDNK